MAIKRYLSVKLESLEQEKAALEYYLRHHKTEDKVEKLLETPGFRELLAPYFAPKSKELYDWMQEPYERSMAFPQNLCYKTSSGNVVRSKSEVMIDMHLYMHRIPFRYECALSLEETVVFPDFTIRHPETGDFYYWEHHGLMDDPAYCKKAFWKQQQYAQQGIIPSINLITTYETKENPLNSEMIEKIISYYFL